MSLPTTIGAYNDCLDVFERALESKRGTRVSFNTEPEANIFQMRMCTARALRRDESRRMYPREDPRYNRTAFDHFVVRRPVSDTEDKWWVYIEPHSSNIIAIEDIEETA